MARIIAILTLAAMTLGLVVVSCSSPFWLSDSGNPLLKDFVEHQMLAVLGVIVTITLASAASLHLELNSLEEATGEGFPEARAATKGYAYLLIGLFASALALVVLKPVFATDWAWEARFNGTALIIVVLNGMALADLTMAVFSIPARRRLGLDDTP